MTAVDIFKASRMLEIENTTVVSGLVDPNGHLLLSTRVGEEIDAGNVIGPQGPGYQYRGAWAPATAYSVRDVVFSNGSTFVVTTAHTSSSTAPTAAAPGTNLSLWAQKGTDGTNGNNGTAGDPAVPAGTISLWGSDTAPANWLICDGAAVSRTTYPSLFDAIGIKYGAGDGVNTFNLPNLKGRTPIGKDATQTEFATLAQTGGEKTHKLTALESGVRDHTHILPMGSVAGVGTTTDVPARASGVTGTIDSNFRTGRIADNTIVANGAGVYGNTALTTSATTDAVNAHNVLQPYAVVNFIIKVTAGETPSDSELTQRLSALEAQFSATPAGTITGWAGGTAPTNWLLCDGAAVSRTTYASLFAAIGTLYGVGDNLTTFNLPNLKGRVPVGRDATQTEFDVLGETGGEKSHILTTGEMPAHTHTTLIRTGITYGAAAGSTIYGVDSSGTTPTGSTGSGTAHNNIQPYQVVNYIIKITNGDTKADSQLTQRVSGLESGTAYSVRYRDKMAAIQRVLTGGGVRKVNGTSGISWSERFMVLGAGRDEFLPGGYVSITMPPNGTVIPVHSRAGVTSNTVAGGYIPLASWGALYYELTPGEGIAGSTNFRILDYRVDDGVAIPPNWILICACNTDVYSPMYTWGDGRSQDPWRTLGLTGGWLVFDAVGWGNPSWRFMDDGAIELKGLIKGGNVATGNAILFDAAYCPDETILFHQAASGGFVRLDVFVTGNIGAVGAINGGTNGWVQLKGIQWRPKGS